MQRISTALFFMAFMGAYTFQRIPIHIAEIQSADGGSRRRLDVEDLVNGILESVEDAAVFAGGHLGNGERRRLDTDPIDDEQLLDELLSGLANDVVEFFGGDDEDAVSKTSDGDNRRRLNSNAFTDNLADVYESVVELLGDGERRRLEPNFYFNVIAQGDGERRRVLQFSCADEAKAAEVACKEEEICSGITEPHVRAHCLVKNVNEVSSACKESIGTFFSCLKCSPQREEARSQCRRFIDKTCSDASTLRERYICYLTNRSSAPKACNMAATGSWRCNTDHKVGAYCLVHHGKPFADKCTEDINEFCGEAHSMNSVRICMRRQWRQMSRPCRASAMKMYKCFTCGEAKSAVVVACAASMSRLCSSAHSEEEKKLCYRLHYKQFESGCVHAVKAKLESCNSPSNESPLHELRSLFQRTVPEVSDGRPSRPPAVTQGARAGQDSAFSKSSPTRKRAYIAEVVLGSVILVAVALLVFYCVDPCGYRVKDDELQLERYDEISV